MPEPGKAVTKTGAAATDAMERDLLSVAKTFEEKQAAFQLASIARQQLMIREAAATIAEQSWGAKLSPIARAAVARYALSTGTDPVRHWEVLGGRLYDRAELWYDLATSQPDYAGCDDPVLIHHDARCSPEEQAERRALRVKWGVPEDTPGAAIITIHTKDRGDFSGCNWVKLGTYKESGKARDPVGLEHPTQTAITRAFRKASKKAWPLWFVRNPKLKAAEEIVVSRGPTSPQIDGSAGIQSAEAEEVEQLAPGEVPIEEVTAAAPRLVRHQPSALCKREDSHAETDCGYAKKAPA